MRQEQPEDKEQTFETFFDNLTQFAKRLKLIPSKIKPFVPVLLKASGEPVRWPLDVNFVPQVSIAELGFAEANHEPAAGSPAVITVTSTEIWEVFAVLASFVVDATVIARTCRWGLTPGGLHTILTAVPDRHTVGTSLSLTASQQGSMYDLGTNFVYVNTNGTVAASGADSESILPAYMYGGDSLNAEIVTNGQAGDKACIACLYRVIGTI